MATTKRQRIGIWVIAITLTVGTLGSFAVMILANENQRNDQISQAEQFEEMQREQRRLAEESAAKSEPLKGYKAEEFKADEVTELKEEVLVEGDGEVVEETDSINVSYFGWLPSGKIFDSTKKEGTNTPIDLSLMGVIPGWTEGLSDQKAGSVVKLTIPADMAYGPQESGIIPANTPLTFIVEIHEINKEQ